MSGLYSPEEILKIHPTHMRTPVHIRAHLHTPAHIPHIPTDALNLINQMKLHVNGKMAEER